MISAYQTTDKVLMIRPANFGFNVETAIDNAFQKDDSSISKEKIRKRAIKEFDTLLSLLRSKGIQVKLINDTKKPVKTDATFPNNWISFHGDGSLITYPMFSPNRRLERQESILNEIRQDYLVTEYIDFSSFEEVDLFLEGTGSMVLDRTYRIAYACRSERTNELLLDRFCKRMGYKKVVFEASDKKNQAIYHTNVMMNVGEDFVIICLESIKNKKERKRIAKQIKKTKKKLIEITFSQMNNFVGNMLQLRNKKGKTYLLMSSTAYKSLTKKQLKIIEKYTKIIHAPIPTIEKFGGGSVRCMIAEIFLPAL